MDFQAKNQETWYMVICIYLKNKYLFEHFTTLRPQFCDQNEEEKAVNFDKKTENWKKAVKSLEIFK